MLPSDEEVREARKARRMTWEAYGEPTEWDSRQVIKAHLHAAIRAGQPVWFINPGTSEQ